MVEQHFRLAVGRPFIAAGRHQGEQSEVCRCCRRVELLCPQYAMRSGQVDPFCGPTATPPGGFECERIRWVAHDLGSPDRADNPVLVDRGDRRTGADRCHRRKFNADELRRKQVPQPAFDSGQQSLVCHRRCDEPVLRPASHQRCRRRFCGSGPGQIDLQRAQIGGGQFQLEGAAGRSGQIAPHSLDRANLLVGHPRRLPHRRPAREVVDPKPYPRPIPTTLVHVF